MIGVRNMQNNESARKLAITLRSPIKSEILFSLEEQEKTFTEMRKAMKPSPPQGTLYYHILVLEKEGLLERNGNRYLLSPLGQRLAKTTRKVDEEISKS